MKNIFYILFLHSILNSQIINSYKFDEPQNTHFSNSITDIIVKNDSIILGTGKGLSISPNKGINWNNYFNTKEFGYEDISSINIFKNKIYVATAHSEQKDNSYLPVGSGIKISKDAGSTWVLIDQPIDKNNIDTIIYGKNKIRSIGVTTKVYNLCYDISANDSAIFIATFAGMLRKSIDDGKNWTKVVLPPDNLNSISPNDSLKFDLSPTNGTLGLVGNLNHRVFSVLVDKDGIIWVGTANGINKSVDGGVSWKKFNYSNQIESISGNFIVSIYAQYFKNQKIIWAATINAESQNETRGISFSFDDGKTWKRTLLGEFAHNFGSKDSIIYVATDNGIFRSNDFGSSWINSNNIFDNNSKYFYSTKKFYAVASQNNKIWAGGNDGLVSTYDSTNHIFGKTWNIYRATNFDISKTSFAYPNPFSPDDEVVRIKYNLENNSNVSLRIFDFGMNIVKKVVQNYPRSKLIVNEETWDGRDENGKYVANGVYFYELKINNSKSDWGKILVIQ